MISRVVDTKRMPHRRLPPLPPPPGTYIRREWEDPPESQGMPVHLRLWHWIFRNDYADANSKGARIAGVLRLWLLCVVLAAFVWLTYESALYWNVFSGD
jgi:hypothetical protein